MALQIFTLGGFGVLRDGKEVALPVQRRVRSALIVFLAAEADVVRERLLGVFWPESDEEKARHALSQALYELRQQLGEWLITSGDRLRIATDVDLDAQRFAQAVNNQQFDTALKWYRGPFLACVDKLPATKPFETWLDSQRAHYERLHRTARRQFIGAQVAAGDYGGAMETARDWVAVTPLEDEAQHRLIELLADSGDTLEAIRQYEVYERLLAADDLTPLEDTKTLIGRIRSKGVRATATLQNIAAKAPAHSAFPDDLEIIRVLGEGSVATVFLAREPALKRLVAVKVLRSELATDEVACQRFEREAQAAATVSHPNVVSVHRVGRLKTGVPFIVMEYIDGRGLDELLDARGTFPIAETQRVMASVAEALAAAHRNGVMHRHVATSNVFIENATDRVVLMDFGFAGLLDSGPIAIPRLTRPGERIGDPLRTSPEQRNGSAVTQETDVYALGLLGYELLAGQLPPGNRVPTAAVRDDIPRELADLIDRCLSEAPRRRPAASDVVQLLIRNATGAPTTSGHPWRDFLQELQKRKVFRAFIGYLAAAFVVLQGADLVLPALPLDDLETWYRGIVAVTLAGFPVALVLSWLFDFTGGGIRRTLGVRLDKIGILLALLGLLLSVFLAVGVWVVLMR